MISRMLSPIRWWLSSAKAQITGTLVLALVLSIIVYICMKNDYIPVFTFPTELSVLGLFAILGGASFLFRDEKQKEMLKYFSRMPWMNVLYAQIGTFFILWLASFISIHIIAQSDPYGTIVRAYSVAVGIIILTVFCAESILLMRQLKIRGK